MKIGLYLISFLGLFIACTTDDYTETMKPNASKDSQSISYTDLRAVLDADLIKTLGENNIDVVIDLVAGKLWPQFLQLLRPGSRYAVSGAIGGALVELDIRTLYLKDLSFFGCTVLEPQVSANLVKLIENEDIKPLVSKVYPLSDIVNAQKEFLTKKHIGKIVLEID